MLRPLFSIIWIIDCHLIKNSGPIRLHNTSPNYYDPIWLV